MAERFHLETLSGVSSNTASTAVVLATANGLAQWDWFTVDATIVGATGGTSSAFLERKIHDSVDQWREWIRFPDVAATVTKKYSVQVAASAVVQETTSSVTATPGAPTLAAGASLGGHPGELVRFVVYNGAGTTAGATCTCYLGCWKNHPGI